MEMQKVATLESKWKPTADGVIQERLKLKANEAKIVLTAYPKKKKGLAQGAGLHHGMNKTIEAMKKVGLEVEECGGNTFMELLLAETR